MNKLTQKNYFLYVSICENNDDKSLIGWYIEPLFKEKKDVFQINT